MPRIDLKSSLCLYCLHATSAQFQKLHLFWYFKVHINHVHYYVLLEYNDMHAFNTVQIVLATESHRYVKCWRYEVEYSSEPSSLKWDYNILN